MPKVISDEAIRAQTKPSTSSQMAVQLQVRMILKRHSCPNTPRIASAQSAPFECTPSSFTADCLRKTSTESRFRFLLIRCLIVIFAGICSEVMLRMWHYKMLLMWQRSTTLECERKGLSVSELWSEPAWQAGRAVQPTYIGRACLWREEWQKRDESRICDE